MPRLLRHWYFLLRASAWLALAFARANWYFKYRAFQDLTLPYPNALSSKEKRRLKHYLYGTTYLSTVFCALRGYPRNRREQHLFTNLAALAYYFDDLVEAFRGFDDTGIAWLDNPEAYGQTADPNGLALHFLYNVYRELPPGDLVQFKNFMHRVFNVETRDLKPMASLPEPKAELERITAEKGGFSVLLFRRVLAHPLSAEEQEAMYQFGYFIQLSDDIFDLWHDRQAGVTTLATYFAAHNDVAGLKKLFEDQVEVMRNAFAPQSTAEGTKAWPGWTRSGRHTAVAALHFLVSITRVCLHHYEDLQKKHGTLPLDDRAAMVMDMEKWGNRARAAREVVMRIEG